MVFVAVMSTHKVKRWTGESNRMAAHVLWIPRIDTSYKCINPSFHIHTFCSSWINLLQAQLWGCAAGKTPFSRSLNCSTRPPFQHFSVPHDSHFNQKSQNFPIFYSKCLNLVNFPYLSLKIGQNPVQEASFGPKMSSESSIFVKKKKKKKNQFSKPPNLALICSTSPNFQPFRLLTDTQT